MPVERGRYVTDILPLRVESGSFLAPADVAGRIENMRFTADGTLISIDGPCPYVPDYGNGYPNYGDLHGICHALLIGGKRDVLLIQDGDTIKVHDGWNRNWSTLIGPSGSGAQIETTVPDHTGVQFPTQFTVTPTGIIIVPQGGRAFYYDGEVVLPLGYSHVPGAPLAHGPESSGTSMADTNNRGYTMGRLGNGYLMQADFGFGRVGTGANSVNGSTGGGVLESLYQYAYQWVDYFGNVSPVSQRSSTIRIATEWVIDERPEHHQKQLLCNNIEDGPTGTIGKSLLRTKDMKNSGTIDLFEVPTNIGAASIASYATIPDNVTKRYFDNMPDAWLVGRPVIPRPVPVFKLSCLAYGRHWIANTPDDPGILIYSQVGRYGTFIVNDEMFPDPQGGQLTGIWLSQMGMVACTQSSTYLIVPDDAGKSFRSGTLDPTNGCVAPSSFANMPDGSCIWLGRDGFMQFANGRLSNISFEIYDILKRINMARALGAVAIYDPISREYRCWVPLDGQRGNGTCFIYDGKGWRRRTDISVIAACITRDHRRYNIVVGKHRDSANTLRAGVWVMDHGSSTYTSASQTSIIETSWIEGFRGYDRKTPVTVELWLRETYNGKATVTLYRDYRMVEAVDTDTSSMDLVSPEDIPPIWGTALWGQGAVPNKFVKRRAYWKKVDIDIPSCEVYKIKISSTNRIEFIGMRIIERGHPGQGRIP